MLYLSSSFFVSIQCCSVCQIPLGTECVRCSLTENQENINQVKLCVHSMFFWETNKIEFLLTQVRLDRFCSIRLIPLENKKNVLKIEIHIISQIPVEYVLLE